MPPRRAPSPWPRAVAARLAADAPLGRLGDRVRGEVERVHEGRATQSRFFPFGDFHVLLRELAEGGTFAARPARGPREARRGAVGDPFRVDAVTDRFVDAVRAGSRSRRDGRDARVATVFCVSGGGSGSSGRAKRRRIVRGSDSGPGGRIDAGAELEHDAVGRPDVHCVVRLRRRDDGVGARARGRRRRAVVAVARAQGQSSNKALRARSAGRDGDRLPSRATASAASRRQARSWTGAVRSERTAINCGLREGPAARS